MAVVPVQPHLYGSDLVLAQVLADAGAVLQHRDSEVIQLGRITNARAQQDQRRNKRASRQDHFVTGLVGYRAAISDSFDPYGAPIFKQHARDEGTGHAREVRARFRTPQESIARTDAAALTDCRRRVADTLIVGVVDVFEPRDTKVMCGGPPHGIPPPSIAQAGWPPG